MKKSQISPESFLKDLEGVLKLVEKIDNLDPEKTDLKKLMVLAVVLDNGKQPQLTVSSYMDMAFHLK